MHVGEDFMKNRLLLLNILGLLLYGCNLNYKTKQSLNEEAIKATKTNQTDLIPATEDNCIQTEGDYLTQHYCINIKTLEYDNDMVAI